MARWASLIDRRRSELPVLLLDTGDFCNHIKRQNSEFENDFFFKAMGLMQYTAAGIGPSEIRMGRRLLFRRAREAGLDLMSANIRDKRDGKPLGIPRKIVEIGSDENSEGGQTIKVGLFSVTPGEYIYGVDPRVRDFYEVDDIRMAAFEAVQELKKKGCDLILAFGQIGVKNCTMLVSEVPGIDIVINGRGAPLVPRGFVKNSSWIVEVGDKRRSLAEIAIVWENGAPVVDVIDRGPEIKEMQDRADLKELNRLYLNERKELSRSTRERKAVTN
jgi:2',3'-cyclic-nucleotide 2'-phosphodiesterase (5'-nucleotidase family)